MSRRLTERALAKKAGIARSSAHRQRSQGKSDAEIIRQAKARRKPAASKRKPRRKPESFADAQARKERALANLRELEEAKMRGELVLAAEVERVWSELAMKVRDAVLGIGSRAAARVPTEWRREIVAVVDEEARRALTLLGDQVVNDSKAA